MRSKLLCVLFGSLLGVPLLQGQEVKEKAEAKKEEKPPVIPPDVKEAFLTAVIAVDNLNNQFNESLTFQQKVLQAQIAEAKKLADSAGSRVKLACGKAEVNFNPTATDQTKRLNCEAKKQQ